MQRCVGNVRLLLLPRFSEAVKKSLDECSTVSASTVKVNVAAGFQVDSFVHTIKSDFSCLK